MVSVRTTPMPKAAPGSELTRARVPETSRVAQMESISLRQDPADRCALETTFSSIPWARPNHVSYLLLDQINFIVRYFESDRQALRPSLCAGFRVGM
jgi:hypothetical protein